MLYVTVENFSKFFTHTIIYRTLDLKHLKQGCIGLQYPLTSIYKQIWHRQTSQNSMEQSFVLLSHLSDRSEFVRNFARRYFTL